MLDITMKRELNQKINILTERLSINEEYVVNVYDTYRIRAGEIEKKGIRSLHATLGAHNREFTDVRYVTFSNYEDFLVAWLQGLERVYGNRVDTATGKKSYIIIQLLSDEKCREYIFDFLKRTFYRKYEDYTREKPPEKLETIWFGDNQNCWGLPITPVFRNGFIGNDQSEIRKVRFNYWTLQHILSTGVVDQTSRRWYRFNDCNHLIGFLNGFPQFSKSIYEQLFLQKYTDYLNRSRDQLNEPLLIPEFRYGENEIQHGYRTDFLILNSYTNAHIAIELSPKSTHSDWEREMKKRNAYLWKYGIATITFTDNDLKSVDYCFEQIKPYLQNREPQKESKEIVLSRLV